MSRHRPSVAVALGPSAIALALLTGCAELQTATRDVLGGGGGGGGRGPQTVAYECDDDREFTARFSADREEVRVEAGGETYALERTGGGGGRGSVYGDDDDEVRLAVGGGAAELSIEGEDDFEDCRAES